MAQADISRLYAAVNNYTLQFGMPPTETMGIRALALASDFHGCNDRFLGVRPPRIDPWGTPYRYLLHGRAPMIRCAGPDRSFETADDL